MNIRESVQPPKNNLVEHVARFCQMLRTHGFKIGPVQTIDALRAMEIAGLSFESDVREALRLVLCSSPSEQLLFDALFAAYFCGDNLRPHAADRKQQSSEEHPLAMGRKQSPNAPSPKSQPNTVKPSRTGDVLGFDTGISQESDSTEPKDTGKSILASLLQKDMPSRARIPLEDLDKAIEAAKWLLHRAKREISRKQEAGHKGKQLDFRKTMRMNLQEGSEFFNLAWKKPRPKRIRFVLFCDGSRSMTGFAERLLQFAYALTCCSKLVEVFLFSTNLKRVTGMLYEVKRQQLRTLPVLGAEWGGGTRIGESLATFLSGEGRHMLGKNTVVMIGSDGLETGSVEILQQSMKVIHSQAASVIWLNPLLAMPGYEPIASGMQAALPYIDTFSSANDPVSFKKMAAAFTCRR
ncbi:vWA domain-containing protein [Brevibacillus reuszeri]|uniref:vWA domain-containing protein n=1 Tax=Brevibacillus reuszeri TaxID=54915 RepID=UPI003D200142